MLEGTNLSLVLLYYANDSKGCVLIFIQVLLRAFAIAIFASAGVPAMAQDTAFKVEALNPGLGPAPQGLDRSSPRATVEALLDLAEAGDFTTAAHLLNLAEIEGDAQAVKAPELARKLYSVIDRQVVINWNELVDRPDGLDAEATTKSAVAGQVRRSVEMWTLTLDGRPYSIRVDRVQVGEADPVWVFSERTVGNIQRLHDAFGPSRYELMLPGWMRADAVWNLMWWEIIGLPIMLLIAGLAGVLVHRSLSALSERAHRDILTAIIQAARLPAVIFTTTLVISLVSGIFVFSGVLTPLIASLVALGFFVSVLVLIINVVDRVIDKLVVVESSDLSEVGSGERRELATKISLARRLLIVIIVCIGTGVVLSEGGVLRTFGFSLLASAGALTLILGFAARHVLANIMSSMQIAVNQSARIGDKVVYKDHICTVERINFTYVLLRVWTGVRLVVPVTEFVSETFENWTIKEPTMTRLIDVRVAHTADVSQLRDIFFEELGALDENELGNEDDQKVMVTDHNVFGQEVTFCLSCANPNTSWALSCEMRERLMARMKALEETGLTVFPDTEAAAAA